MAGSLGGNLLGTGYFILFQLAGIIIAYVLFQKEKTGFCVLMGSVTGSFLLQWLPALVAFLWGFTVISHVVAAVLLLVIVTAVIIVKRKIGLPAAGTKEKPRETRQKNIEKEAWGKRFLQSVKNHPVIFVMAAIYCYMVKVLWHHTLTLSEGAFLTGQATYGDMNMHLGFVTSIANQGFFPPEYSLLPGTQLSYPFLSDTISSSIYLMGASLKWSYLLPMFVAILQVFVGMYALAWYLLEKKGRCLLAFLFFFLNGGFGVFYFISKGFSDPNFTRIFSEFYQTPTNYMDGNIQWHNIIVDMLIPQRATLFGWAVLFPLLYFLTKARGDGKDRYFVFAGILAGGLPLIHTHSFLALGILCCGFVLADLKARSSSKKEIPSWGRVGMVLAVFGGLALVGQRQLTETPFDGKVLFGIGMAIVLAFLCWILFYIRSVDRQIWMTWGVFLGIVMVLALPLLFGFTFRQAVGEQFTRGGFDWANTTDPYLWFCVKNYGVMFFLVLGILLWGSRKQREIILPAAFLWLVSEFIVFQPNIYDNNKLLLVGYLYFCIAAADFVCEQAGKIKQVWLSRSIVIVIAFMGTVSAVLTMGREYVAEYELYSKAYVDAAAYVQENTDSTDLILTATNHNNAVASLTGRSIVCGASTFLYYHGVDYGQNEADVKTMYENPAEREMLLKEYGVDYIVIGGEELSRYAISDYDAMLRAYPVVFQEEGIVILQVRN